MLFRFYQIFCHINVNFLITESHCRPDSKQPFQIVGTVTRFLLQFPCSRFFCRLVRSIQPSCRNLQRIAIQRIAVLPYHQQLPVLSDRNHCRRPFMADKIPFYNIPIGYLNRIFIEIHNSSMIHQFPIQPFKFLRHNPCLSITFTA